MSSFQTLMQQGAQQLENGNLAEAETSFRAALEIHPQYDDTLQLLGLTLSHQGKVADGEKLIREAIRINPQNIRARNNLACLLRDQGRLRESSGEFQQLYLLVPEDHTVCTNLAIVLNDLGHSTDARRFSTEALALAPQWAQAHRVHGLVLKNLGELENASACIAKALEIEPGNPEFMSNMSSILIEQEAYEEAEKAARNALEIAPHRADAHHNLGVALARQYREVEAISHLEHSLLLDPHNAKVYCDLATTINDLGELDRAMNLYLKAQAIDPNLSIARFGIGILQLTKGDFAHGWHNYEARKTAKELHTSHPPSLAPIWSGENLQDKRLLLYSEQGYGDILQFMRFLPRLLELGARIDLEIPPELTGLIKENHWPIEFISRTEAEYEQYDFECALLSIPKALNLESSDLPITVSYLKSNPDKLAYWQDKLGEPQQPRIGLCWAGSATHKNDNNRSIATDIFSHLCADIDADFVSLQKDAYESELQDFAANGIQLIDYSEEFFNFAETAALIDCLDLVITVDTVIAHLAGGLNKKTWVLIPFVPDWRWLEQRVDSPWYPRMQLFRQPALGNWETVIDQVNQKLGDFVRSRSS